MSVTVPGLSVSVTGLSVIVYGLSVANFPESGTQMCKLPDWPGNVTGLLGTLTDRLVKVTDCTVCFPGQSVINFIHRKSCKGLCPTGLNITVDHILKNVNMQSHSLNML